MHSRAAVKLVGVAERPRAVHRHGLAARGALLTCFAIVLNAVPFAKPTTREPARVKTESVRRNRTLYAANSWATRSSVNGNQETAGTGRGQPFPIPKAASVERASGGGHAIECAVVGQSLMEAA
jgi:hypothetical protein